MNQKRKRSPHEQEAYDEIERFKDTLRDAKRDRDVCQAELLSADADCVDPIDLFSRYALARDKVAVFEARLREMDGAYRRLREQGCP